jgi:4-amino-4-deoxy-L-arabinose transferase-like glycosyltransferase
MAFAAAMLAAISPWGAVLAGIPMSDGLFLLLLAVVFFGLVLTVQARTTLGTVVGAIGTGLSVGADVLVRPVWPILIFIPAAFVFCYRAKLKAVLMVGGLVVLFAVTPVLLWEQRNQTTGHFNGLTDITGKAAWRYLAARVEAEASGRDRYEVAVAFDLEDRHWQLSVQEADNERWRRAMEVFKRHRFLTVYSFFRSAMEHVLHPSPDVLVAARLSFPGDFFALAICWSVSLILALLGCLCTPDAKWDGGEIDRRLLFALFATASSITLLSGMSFAAGSRLRTPLELTIPLLAAIGLIRLARAVFGTKELFKPEG